jgi:hypothetical protein
MSVSMTSGGGRRGCLGCGGLLAFQGFLADVVAVELGGHGQHGEQHRSHALGP